MNKESDKTLQNQLKVLAKVGKKLNDAKITWAVGASLLLYLEGVVAHFNDIDLMVAEEWVEETKSILLEMGTLELSKPNAQYKTKHFLEAIIEGVEVDVIAGFVIVNNGIDYYFPLKEAMISGYKVVEGVKIPVQTLADWERYYDLMGRTEKVKLLQDRGISC